MEKQVEMPTAESIDRLHVVNQIRDLLKENSKLLEDTGFTEVLLFGSVEKGTANHSSDIDLCFIHHNVESDIIELSEKLKFMKSVVSQVLSKCEKDISFYPPQAGENQDVIHITMQPIDVVIMTGGRPHYAVESFSLWSVT